MYIVLNDMEDSILAGKLIYMQILLHTCNLNSMLVLKIYNKNHILCFVSYYMIRLTYWLSRILNDVECVECTNLLLFIFILVIKIEI